MEKGPVECILKIRQVECVPKREPDKWNGIKGMNGKVNPTDPLLGRHHLRPLTDQLFHDVKLPSEERVLLHVHLVNVHLEQVEVEACQKGFMTKIATHCGS